MNVWGYATNQLVPIVSDFTLAALIDTGYYSSVNLLLAELLPWGAH